MDKDLYCYREVPKHSKEDKDQDHYGEKKVIWTDSKYIVNTAMTPEVRKAHRPLQGYLVDKRQEDWLWKED